jgi:hypothetical protein
VLEYPPALPAEKESVAAEGVIEYVPNADGADVDAEYEVPLIPTYVYVTDVAVAESEPPKFDRATLGVKVCPNLIFSRLALTIIPER